MALVLLGWQDPVTPTTAPPAPVSALPELTLSVDRTTRLLVVAPHPDDEALGAAGLIARVRAGGGAVKVLLITSGDAFPEGVELTERIAHPGPADYRSYGTLRERETQAAMARLGVAVDGITFLGYPDEGVCHLASTYLSDKRAFRSPYSDRSSPPATERIIRGVAYRGMDLRREIEQVVTRFAPTMIALPHADDDHPDHCATHIFVKEALKSVTRPLAAQIRLLSFLIHYQQWPLSDDAGTGSILKPPAGFPASEGRWVSLRLTPGEAAVKKQALLDYTSQMQVIGRFMTGFGRDNELFIEGEPASLPECWCDDGENVATESVPPRNRRKPARRP